MRGRDSNPGPPAFAAVALEIGLVARQTRVQLPDSYICAKLVDFALSAVEEMVRHFDVTTSDYIIPLYLLLGDI